jgi:hypothetical protein
MIDRLHPSALAQAKSIAFPQCRLAEQNEANKGKPAGNVRWDDLLRAGTVVRTPREKVRQAAAGGHTCPTATASPTAEQAELGGRNGSRKQLNYHELDRVGHWSLVQFIKAEAAARLVSTHKAKGRAARQPWVRSLVPTVFPLSE